MNVNLEQSLRNPDLLGGSPHFRDLSTWPSWLTFIRAVEGSPMDAEDLTRFRLHTGRRYPRAGGYPEAVAVIGVQSGKSQIGAAFVAHAALTGATGTHALLLGQDYRGSMRVLLRYSREPFETIPAFQAEVVRATADTLDLRSGVSLSAYPCRPAAVRGLRACIVVIDELAYFTATDGRPTDTEMLRVARGRLATTGGKLIVLSSPYGQTGALWDLHRQHYGVEDSPTLVWQASAPEMNPTLSADYLQRMQQTDPEAYQSEVLGFFRSGLSQLLDPEAVNACVDTGVRERPPVPGTTYIAADDIASGSGKDAFAFAIAHRDGDRIVLDLLRTWKPPFNVSGTIAEVADLCGRYGITEVVGDEYAAGFAIEGYAQHRLKHVPMPFDTSTTYLELVPLVNTGQVRLLDLPESLRELRHLERRRGSSGRDKVDHRRGAHDDAACALARALVRTAPRTISSVQVIQLAGFGGEPDRGPSTSLDDWRARQERVRREKQTPY